LIEECVSQAAVAPHRQSIFRSQRFCFERDQLRNIGFGSAASYLSPDDALAQTIAIWQRVGCWDRGLFFQGDTASRLLVAGIGMFALRL